eukprot:8935922-Ditylum_brightwellii.AAC.1
MKAVIVTPTVTVPSQITWPVIYRSLAMVWFSPATLEPTGFWQPQALADPHTVQVGSVGVIAIETHDGVENRCPFHALLD